jgi:hypothetical protein
MMRRGNNNNNPAAPSNQAGARGLGIKRRLIRSFQAQIV